MLSVLPHLSASNISYLVEHGFYPGHGLLRKSLNLRVHMFRSMESGLVIRPEEVIASIHILQHT